MVVSTQIVTLFFAVTSCFSRHRRCHAALLSPSSTHPCFATASHPLAYRKFNNDRRSVSAVVRKQSSYNNDDIAYGGDEWNDAVSGAILGGQGDAVGAYDFLRGGDASAKRKLISAAVTAISPSNALRSIRDGYAQRIASDSAFLSKSILEVVLAVLTQCVAEVGSRGKDRMLVEIDFVFAGVLTAVCGKYYSMWKVAKTVGSSNGEAGSTYTSWRYGVPTNAFQPTLLDGQTVPSPTSRLLAIFVPMPQLFRAGCIASAIGYGLTSVFIRVRSLVAPNYVVLTREVPVFLAAVYTGLFMALVSNIRYQVLQGLVEPYFIDGVFSNVEDYVSDDKRHIPGRVSVRLKVLRNLKSTVIVLVRYANGVLGSWIAICGMRALGLQKLKE